MKMTGENVIQAMPGGIISRQQQTAFQQLDAAIVAALDEAKKAGVPQGMIVALMHGHAHAETHHMVAAPAQSQ